MGQLADAVLARYRDLENTAIEQWLGKHTGHGEIFVERHVGISPEQFVRCPCGRSLRVWFSLTDQELTLHTEER